MKRCPKCKGRGEVRSIRAVYPSPRAFRPLETCRHCGGTGKLAIKKGKR